MLRNINATSIFWPVSTTSDMWWKWHFYSIFLVLLSCLYAESVIWLFMYRDALFYLSNRKKKSSKYEWTYWTLFCVTFIVMSSWKWGTLRCCGFAAYSCGWCSSPQSGSCRKWTCGESTYGRGLSYPARGRRDG